MQPIICFRGFSFQYREQAEPTLHNINLDIFPGEKILIAGASGSGKSTLMNCINGLIPFSYAGTSSGQLIVDGMEPRKKSIFALSKSVGTVLQDPDGQFIGLTVGEDIAFSLENDCVQRDIMQSTVLKTAELVDIQTHLVSAPYELSGGQKQRVSLAGVLVDNVKILLFDEPLANLDPATGKQTIDLIDRIQRETNTTILIVEHRLEDVLYRDVDRIVLMDNGRIVADMKPDALISSSLLPDHGIREPLYITAMRYAGVAIEESKHPQHIESLLLTADDKEMIRSWYEAAPHPTAARQREELLKVEKLSFGYEDDHMTLSDISFSISKGEIVAIVGRNGAGKSTLSKLICGFETPDSGSICMGGRNIRGDTIRERAAHIGYVMQNPNQMISKTMIYDEVALGLQNSGLTQDEIRSNVENALKICGLYPFRNWPISALSFGQKKRVTIASVLVMSPEIIILDEPTAGQDFKHYTEFMEFLRGLNQKGITVLIITHDMHLMLEYTQRALVFDTGRMIADSQSARVLCDGDLIKRAALKETSLFTLAELCGIDPPESFVECFIGYDREVREHGKA